MIIDDPLNPMSAASKSLAKKIMEALCKHYPSLALGWNVTVVQDQGIVQITNSYLSGKMGFVLHVTKVDPEMKCIIRNAGELLERYNVLRDKALGINEALKHTKYTRTGQMIHEV